MNNILKHCELTAEFVEDKYGPAIMLTQEDGGDEPSCVMLHPWQLREVCEQFGIIASDPQAEKTIATLSRRLRLLRERIAFLHGLLLDAADKHPEIACELAYSGAALELADEFCFEGEGGKTPAATTPDQKTGLQSPLSNRGAP